MKTRELFSPIPKEIFRKDDVRERVEIFLVLFVVAGLGYKFVKGSIKDYLSLDDPDVALAVFVNAAVAAAFLFAYLLACWVIRLALSWGDVAVIVTNQEGNPILNQGEPGVFQWQKDHPFLTRYEATKGGFFKLPESEVILSEGVLVQNPGWEKAESDYAKGDLPYYKK